MELARLQTLLARGLVATALMWPDIQTAYAWVHQAAHLFANSDQHSVDDLQRRFDALLADIAQQQATLGSLTTAVAHFLKVTASYAPGLFHCYRVPDLPRTNNDLEHFFGSARYHERRISGRKVAAPGTVVRGAVRLTAAVATRLHPFDAAHLRPRSLDAWRAVRQVVAERHEARRAQLRYRRDPDRYLAHAETQLLKPALPA